MRVVVDVDGGDDVVGPLEAWLRARPSLDDVELTRGRGTVEPGRLGAPEILTFVAANVVLPLVLSGVYDFVKQRRRSRPASTVRVVLIRTDLPGAGRRVELEVDGPPEVAVELARKALEAPGPDE